MLAKMMINVMKGGYRWSSMQYNQQYNMRSQIISKEVPYQITVNNITPIGHSFMSDYYIAFYQPHTQQTYTSPIVHGKIIPENTKYPWTFNINSHQLEVHFHAVDKKSNQDQRIGSTPLLLMKRQGEEQFLIFGCVESNKGRKVAQVQFSYRQVSIKSSEAHHPSLLYSKAIKKNSADTSLNSQHRRISLNYTIQEENYQNSTIKFNTHNQIEPQNMKTLLEQSQAQSHSQDSHIDMHLLRQIQDTSDKWYRHHFGKQKPPSLDPYDFEINQISRIVTVNYEPNYQYLNDISFTDPHIQLKNMVINSDKKPTSIQIYGMQLDKNSLLSYKIAGMSSNASIKKEWNGVVRLPKETKAYGVSIYTNTNQKIKGLIINDCNYNRNSIQLFDEVGTNVGSLAYNLKQLKKIQIQTVELMVDVGQEGSKSAALVDLQQSNKQSNKSALVKTLLNSEDGNHYHNKKYKLINQIYLNRYNSTQPQPLTRNIKGQVIPIPKLGEASTTTNQHQQQVVINESSANQAGNMRDLLNGLQRSKQQQRQISNKPYFNRQNNTHLSPFKKNIRKNQYELLHQHHHTPSHNYYHLEQAAQPPPPYNLQNQVYLNQKPNISPSDTYTYNRQIQEGHQIQQGRQKPQQSQRRQKSKTSYQNSQSPSKMPPKPPTLHSSSKSNIKSNRQQKPSKLSSNRSQQQKAFLDLLDKQSINNHHQSQQLPQIDISNIDSRQLSANTRGDHINEDAQLTEKSDSNNNSHQNRQHLYQKNSHRQPIGLTPHFTSIIPHHHTTTTQQPQQNIINKASQPQINSNNNDQELPIKRYKTTTNSRDKPNINAFILSKPSHYNNNLRHLAHPEKQVSKVNVEREQPYKGGQNKQINQQGMNTQRIALVQNVLQSTYVPTTNSERRVRNNNREDEKSKIEHIEQSNRQEIGSILDIITQQNDQLTKYSSQTIQPSTQVPTTKTTAHPKSILINSISISYYSSLFGNKSVQIRIPKKQQYETNYIHNSHHLIWKCQDFIFRDIREYECLHVNLFDKGDKGRDVIGKAIVTYDEIRGDQEVGFQNIIRTYLTTQNSIVGEIIIGYQTYFKRLSLPKNQQKRHKTSQYETLNPNQSQQGNKQVSPSRKKKKKAKDDYLTEFLKQNRKQKINRYLVNEFSRANIQARINPIRQKKFGGGKNIVIGRDVRFPYSLQEQQTKNIPGPNCYKQQSIFQKYISNKGNHYQL